MQDIESFILVFKEMGFDENTADFLSWCMKNRNNLEWAKIARLMDNKAIGVMVHFDDLGIIQKIDYKRT